MAKLNKRMKALNAKVEASKVYTAVEALDLVKETAVAKFDESVDVASSSASIPVSPTRPFVALS